MKNLTQAHSTHGIDTVYYNLEDAFEALQAYDYETTNGNPHGVIVQTVNGFRFELKGNPYGCRDWKFQKYGLVICVRPLNVPLMSWNIISTGQLRYYPVEKTLYAEDVDKVLDLIMNCDDILRPFPIKEILVPTQVLDF